MGFWTLLSCILLSGVLHALPTDTGAGSEAERQKDFNLSMYVDGPRLNASPNCRSASGPGSFPGFASSIIIQGWTASANSGTAAANATGDIYSCLNACRNSDSGTDPPCRFVRYNIETGVCTKFFKTAATTGKLTFSRNFDVIIAAFSEKRFTNVPSTDFFGDDLAPVPIGGTATADFCKLFCHLHPTCNVATFQPAGWGTCYLKSKPTLTGATQSSGSSFIS
ncbi:hypothetical protein RvY_11862 [Ramazzottius varieornatus]|uniref:Apple domain-containing protein n=1 Tax=Ramazzottius varieornatus TaxID=947166 RepID=A0A1D1VHG7_RAMVA|nr:hypothetical protein RvY_11862 [Ramazzottius varieornatus]